MYAAFLNLFVTLELVLLFGISNCRFIQLWLGVYIHKLHIWFHIYLPVFTENTLKTHASLHVHLYSPIFAKLGWLGGGDVGEDR